MFGKMSGVKSKTISRGISKSGPPAKQKITISLVNNR